MSNFNAPASIAETVIGQVGVKKCQLSFWQVMLLGILAGAFIAFGAQLATRVMANVVDPGIGIFLGGAVFSVGLMLVVIAGAELFTGNNLIFMSVLGGETKVSKMLVYWLYVWVANLLGSLLLVWFMYQSGLVSGVVADKAVAIAKMKASLPWEQIFFRGIMCNWLVCLAVWLALASHDIVGKIFGIFFPIMAFVTSGFEHSVANMYFIPIGMALNPEAVTMGGLVNNLVWATIGNIVGGAGFVAFIYYMSFRKCALPKK
ncbi:MAG: formate/nitrite transporter family protein [Candidatus Krumholzibacteria bacterium]|nr:formate/nitrite transporter family protein [Candidatus Krumholzibacteria bacterium]